MTEQSPSPAGRRLALFALVVLALNMRPAAVSVGPVLAEVRDGLDMSTTVAGVLTSLPVVLFALVGAVAPWLSRTVGIHRTILASLLAVTAGLALRSMVDSPGPFLVLSAVALAGMATANVLLPSLVKLHFPDRVGTVTALYTTAMAIGLTCSLLLTVPVAEQFGGWRVGLGVWAALALLSALPWLLMAAHDRHVGPAGSTIRLGAVARTPLGIAMALFFGLQSTAAYTIFGWFAQLWRDSGYSPAQAGALVGLVAGVSIPLSLWIPRAAAAREDQRVVLLAVMACYPVGYVGLMVAPYSGAIAWAVLIGVGACTFPLILSLIPMRARTAEGTAALSGWTQSAGYLIAAIGPLAVGATYDATGGWTLPLGLLLVLAVPQLLLGLYCSRPGYIEDQLAR
ncbi:CP family cyanate transporter-like MFS transporter [Nocardioides daedukensis]|uniref:CP family cyanate transporter-like MFS transporter n=1 Tax=Nocardioides daedukensis TaxID=634462 RepID=A0A7Y9UQ77_9ACTN|nr:CP family cyanate transporter-like MFS transporter [Nocardioides daedukensis]